MVKNLAANAGKFCTRVIHVSLRRYKLGLTRVVKEKVNKFEKYKRNGNVKIRIKSIQGINIIQNKANITNKTRCNGGKKYGCIRSKYKVHIGTGNNVYVCKEPVWRAGRPRVHKQYGKCTVSIRKQMSTGKNHVSFARNKSARKTLNNKNRTYVTVNVCRMVYSRTCITYNINISNCVYNVHRNQVTEYNVANIRKVMYSRQIWSNIEKDVQIIICVNIGIRECTIMVTVQNTYSSLYVTETASNGTANLPVLLKMDPRTVEEQDKDMDTDTHKTVVAHGKNYSLMFSGDLMINSGGNPNQLLNNCLLFKLSNSCYICCRPSVNKCVVISRKNALTSSNHIIVLCIVDIKNMFVNLEIGHYTHSCANRYRVVCTANTPHHIYSRTARNIVYVYSTTSRLHKVSMLHNSNIHKVDGDSSHTRRTLPCIPGKTRKGISLTVSKSNSRYGE